VSSGQPEVRPKSQPEVGYSADVKDHDPAGEHKAAWATSEIPPNRPKSQPEVGYSADVKDHDPAGEQKAAWATSEIPPNTMPGYLGLDTLDNRIDTAA
jgi:hypothetical protein